MKLTARVFVGLLVAATAVIAQEPQVYQPGNGVSTPKVVKEVAPHYTQEAMKARIQGTVLLSTVVRQDGTVSDVSVTRSLDAKYGLDDEAVKAVKQWTFSPGLKDGKAVAVKVTIEMAFSLGKRR
jgi:protein TonB